GVAEADSTSADAVAGTDFTRNSATATTTGPGTATVLGGGLAQANSQDGHAVNGGVTHGNSASATGGGQVTSEGGGLGVLAAIGDALTGATVSGNSVSATSSSSSGAAAAGGGVAGAASSTGAAISDSVIRHNTASGTNNGGGNGGAGGAGIAAVTAPIVSTQVTGNVVTATAGGTNPNAPVEVNGLGGGLTAAENDEPGSTASEISDSTFAGNSIRSSYTGSGSGLAQAVGAGLGASTGIADSTVSGNAASAAGSGTGVDVGPAPVTSGPAIAKTMLSGGKVVRSRLTTPLARTDRRVVIPALTAILRSSVHGVLTQVRHFGARRVTMSARRAVAGPADA